MQKQKVGIKQLIRFYKENSRAFKAYPLRDKSRVNITLANMKIATLNPLSELYAIRVQELNDASIYHYCGKWYATRALKSKKKSDWQKAFKAFKTSLGISTKLQQLLNEDTNNKEKITYKSPIVKKNESEIEFVDDVPLVPEITPIVLLQGSSFDMGYQYAEQLVNIFGAWILKRHIRNYNEQELIELKKWEDVHLTYTPEIIDFVKGWAQYAKEQKLELSYHNILDLWVGHKAPASSYLNAESGIPELPPLACTALAAWNQATKDKDLIVAATGDHDMSYQITIAMWPNDGNALVFTAFEATGTLPTVGANWFFGHPAMNNKGLAYVHHGGGPKLLEPIVDWGYGIRRTASVLHNLRYKSTAKEALKQELEWPIGDIGYGDQATVGGFYADNNYGYIIESRKDPKCIREAGILGEKDYLFSNNSVMHPKAIESQWMRKIKDLWLWDNKGGFRPKQPQGMTKSFSMILKWFSGRLKTDELMSRGMMFAYWNSYNRNLFLNSMAKKYFGKLSVANMKKIYRTSGTLPAGKFKTIKKNYLKTGEWGKISAAHSSNALVVIMKPSAKLYSLCTGPAKRGIAPVSPDLAISIYNERNTFWDLKLMTSPYETVLKAKELAHELLKEVQSSVSNNKPVYHQKIVYEELNQYVKQMNLLQCKLIPESNLMLLNKLIRVFTSIHVIARQFLHIGSN